MTIYYFDHAATSWPKPPGVKEAMAACLEEVPANPGRGQHAMALQAGRLLLQTRSNLAKLFRIRDPLEISFAANATAALNLAIKGFVREGDHVICTSVEHNAVRRPLEYLRDTRQVDVTYLPAAPDGRLALDELERAFRENTTLVVCSHSSNLLGTIQPVGEIGRMCRQRGVKLLVDAAQTAGTYPIDVQAMQIDMLAFPGHKGLLGPQGTGGLYVSKDIVLEPLLHGGTGGQSELAGMPDIRPDRYEAGTLNTVGIAGLNAGVQYVLGQTVEAIHRREWQLTQRLMEGLQAIDGIELLGPGIGEERTAIAAFRWTRIDSAELASILDQSFGIAVRAGYHCAPLAHETAGTAETGAVRASVGYATSEEEVAYFLDAMRQIAVHYG
ncbi:cysteine desulfurase [Paenibacillus sp. J31TS4]|uniref:aminotransferase class V-fold PLP-dependent enzyme n=1 Tax=Paenibacillus sp. J31TS4 TaxID=2807195 RepID=UPI001B16CDC9|nr:aminotransferase class V-fold PLP-dependent enzyme [Paenibacillus sp. J31TS4]GIP40636.1 cysteine desulfurase [Paenibacillus sp. J31TS4]